jgi:AbrB family looped-hinge helix DNA binding protein
MRARAKVSRKGLTTIPAWVRRELGIEEGDFLIWEIDRERGSISVRVVKNPLKHLKGKYNDPQLSYDMVEEVADSLLEGEVRAGTRARHASGATEQSR